MRSHQFPYPYHCLSKTGGYADDLFDQSLGDVADMSGLEHTHFMNDILIDYLTSKDLRQTKMEKFLNFSNNLLKIMELILRQRY